MTATAPDSPPDSVERPAGQFFSARSPSLLIPLEWSGGLLFDLVGAPRVAFANMHLLDWLWSLLFGTPRRPPVADSATDTRTGPAQGSGPVATGPRGPTTPAAPSQRARLTRRTYASPTSAARPAAPTSSQPPYLFARPVAGQTVYLDLSQDTDPARLEHWGLPLLRTPEELARWLELTPAQLAWLAARFRDPNDTPSQPGADHYHRRWVAKRRGGRRLIESPKQLLKQTQARILEQILDRVPPHPSAHGFRRGHSIVSNARPHVGQAVVLRLDLANFYPSVTYNRVVALFRSLGYCREVACWLARLTTTVAPAPLLLNASATERALFRRRHLPQGAPTSPALANLSAFVSDLRLAGLARSFDVRYTRYADDLTFSGPATLRNSLRVFLPLVRQILKQERFTLHPGKRRVERASQRQQVTGVVVNAKINCCRRDFDLLKAILTNCLRHGPSGQNRSGHAHFNSHLRGRIAHIARLNPRRGRQLLTLYQQIDWSR
ncbi:MAG: reverse transcriptase domain-containing protein [Planctomycetaceae bacterium]